MIYTYQKKLNGKKVGIVFGTFAPLHQGHLDLIMRAKKECDGGCVVLVEVIQLGTFIFHEERRLFCRPPMALQTDGRHQFCE